MGRRTTVQLAPGKIVSGEVVDFESEKESWNIYKVEDGTVLKLKAVVTQIVRLDEFKPDGEPIYLLQSSNVVTSDVPDNLKLKKAGGDEVKH